MTIRVLQNVDEHILLFTSLQNCRYTYIYRALSFTNGCFELRNGLTIILFRRYFDTRRVRETSRGKKYFHFCVFISIELVPSCMYVCTVRQILEQMLILGHRKQSTVQKIIVQKQCIILLIKQGTKNQVLPIFLEIASTNSRRTQNLGNSYRESSAPSFFLYFSGNKIDWCIFENVCYFNLKP